MLCKIADLTVEIPDAGGMAPRCGNYLTWDHFGADVVIRTESYCKELYPQSLSPEDLAYMETGRIFYSHLLDHDGMFLHASAVELEGRAYLFSGDSGVGKSTHTRLWQRHFGAQIFNDDKPALRFVDGRWYAYGTPWCGKDGINQNKKVPLAGICFLRQAKENRIRAVSTTEAVTKILLQTFHRYCDIKDMELTLACTERLLKMIPVFELENLPNEDAARLSMEVMRREAEERKL